MPAPVILPYASELVGVYQPLLGWRSRLTKERAQDEIRSNLELVSRAIKQQLGAARETSGLPLQLNEGEAGEDFAKWTKTRVGEHVRQGLRDFIAQKKRLPFGAEWKVLVGKNKLDKVLQEIATTQVAAGKKAESDGDCSGMKVIHKSLLSRDEAVKLGAKAVEGSDLIVVPGNIQARTAAALQREYAAAATMTALGERAPQLLQGLFTPRRSDWEVAVPFVDPLANFDARTVDAVLSPVGLIHLYREYFFEQETFLGPPVGHVWISPGGTVELIEVNTRRTLNDHLTESLQETITKSESATEDQDELSDSVKEDNERNIKLGVSASGGVNFGVVHAEASANFGYESTRKLAHETAHKHTRQQSEKLSGELRRNFKTTFRVTSEVTDTSSRRYVVQNTSSKLVNYELRRKMRRVAVQVQHLATQLCWQVYVDDPGQNLGLAELVHVAQPEDATGAPLPPEAPALPPKKEEEREHVCYFEPIRNSGGMEDEDFLNGNEVGDTGLIRFQWDVNVTPPGAGYVLESIMPKSIDGTTPGGDAPVIGEASYDPIAGKDAFRVSLRSVNFSDNRGIRFIFTLVWGPDAATVSAVTQANVQRTQDSTNQKARDQRVEYVKAVRERVKMAGDVSPRVTEELREEERTVVYRKLISQLVRIAGGPGRHVTAELVRALFDVDKMLYFVAPEWWQPRQHASVQQVSQSTLTEDDKVGWGGVGMRDRDNYLITEDSRPAPLGSSLGWLLQLDGDNSRNAFLNSPWVKAVIPIRPGRERAALNWLNQSQVEGTDGMLDDQGNPIKYLGEEPGLKNKPLKEVLEKLADGLAVNGTDIRSTLATETIYETGFKPLAGGFKATGNAQEVFDQWTEVLPTDQVVAVEYPTP